ncbi:hypothetical protein ACHAXT_001928 [Thalassiosira profunda]
MSGTGNENEEPNHRRSTRARKQREANPCEFLDEEENAASAAGRPASRDSSSTTASNHPSNDPSTENRLAMPPTNNRWQHWSEKTMDDLDEFSTVDGRDKLAYTYRGWDGAQHTHFLAAGTMVKAEKALVAQQNAQQVEINFDSSGYRLTQVPYHADLLPYYEILPTLETTSKLVLSHCSLSGDDLASLATFLQGNTTLCSLDLSQNTIDSADTLKAIAKALNKKCSSITSVNLSECSLGGDNAALEKLLASLKKCRVLEIGHKSMDSEAVASIAKFVGKKNALTFFSFVGAPIDKENKKTLEASLAKNKTIESLCLSSNGLALPGVIRTTKKAMKSMSKLTYLELSFNSLPVQGAKALAKFLEHADCSLESLVLSNNHLTTKGANHILPALKENESLEELDLSLQTIANSNHTCAVLLSGRNTGGLKEETIRKINEMDVAEGVKIRYKVVLALTEVNKDLYDPLSFNDVPLELMPYLITLVQQEIGCNSFGRELVATTKKDRGHSVWVPSNDPTLPWWSGTRKHICDPTLSNIYEVIMGWQSLPLLFVNGAGELPKKAAKQAAKKKSRKRRRKFGEEEDDDDEPYIPKGARKTAKYVYNQETHRYDCVLPAPVY